MRHLSLSRVKGILDAVTLVSERTIEEATPFHRDGGVTDLVRCSDVALPQLPDEPACDITYRRLF
jgi:hypothetical protein